MDRPGDSHAQNLQEQIAEEVRALLARRRISGRQITKELGWSSAYLSRRLNGWTAFTISDLEALASLLDIPVTRLLPRSEDGFITRREWSFPRLELAA